MLMASSGPDRTNTHSHTRIGLVWAFRRGSSIRPNSPRYQSLARVGLRTTHEIVARIFLFSGRGIYPLRSRGQAAHGRRTDFSAGALACSRLLHRRSAKWRPAGLLVPRLW